MNTWIRSLTAAITIAAVLLVLIPVGPARAADPIIVTRADDPTPDGCVSNSDCSLREAIIAAEANAGPDTIEFNIPGCGGVCTIQPTSAYNLSVGDTTIDGYSQPGASPATGSGPATILIEIDGSSAPASTIAFTILGSSENSIRGLAIHGFEYGIQISGSLSTGNTIAGCHIGVNPGGTMDMGNAQDGVLISLSANNNTIGGTTNADRNVISGNERDGIRLETAHTNAVLGNYIGPDGFGYGDLGNSGNGITVWSGAYGNVIGGAAAGAGNVISGNGVDGITLSGGTVQGNQISGNIIGLTYDGLSALSNGQNGIQVINNPYSNTIGGDVAGAGNVISANVFSGILLGSSGTQLNTISGNLIGTDIFGTVDRGNGSEGIRITTGAHDNTVGGDTAPERNLISGNNQGGVRILGSGTDSNVVSGNYIGTDLAGSSPVPNAYAGVEILSGARFNTVGGDTAGERNVISGNDTSGVGLSGSGTTGNIITGNYIGTTASGASAMGNAYGVSLSSETHDNQVGGGVAGAGNLISGNDNHGVWIYGTGVNNNMVSGNRIGTDASGLVDLGNGNDGVRISSGASYNTIGGNTAARRNIISGNDGWGVRIDTSTTQYNEIEGNYIGTDITGLFDLGNAYDGVYIASQAMYNTIGGYGADWRNVIGGNGQCGVEITSAGTDNNAVVGNYIGLASDGLTPVGNSVHGICLTAGVENTTIGGSAVNARNVISGNGMSGVSLGGVDTTLTKVFGNRIGTDAPGTSAVPNGDNGVEIYGGAHHNAIGGSVTGQGNLISGNTWLGVFIEGAGTNGNTVVGNRIGTDQLGTGDLGNGASGVTVTGGAQSNLIGGTDAASRNVISGNAGGVHFSGSGTSSNVVMGNYIGVNNNGVTPLPNDVGVMIFAGATFNTVGGLAAGAGNVISANDGVGVHILDPGTTGNLVQGNIIGLDASGTLARGNGNEGVLIQTGAAGNTIGGTSSAARNIISGNGSHGVWLKDADTASNQVSGNYIGTDVTGSLDLGNGAAGVMIYNGARDNIIGGGTAAEGNVIAGNNSIGVDITGTGTTGNEVKRNLIGVDAAGISPLPNMASNVSITSGAQDNTIGPDNIIAYNSYYGVWIDGASTYNNRITQNSIHDHGTQGIDLNAGANNGISPPTISSTVLTPPITISGAACTGCTVEVFANPDADGEGWIYLGSTTAGGAGWGLTVSALPHPHLTATATDTSGNTSEFSMVYTTSIRSLFLPLIMR
jgi:hypothetical protein